MDTACKKSGTPDDQQFKLFVASGDGLHSLRCDAGHAFSMRAGRLARPDLSCMWITGGIAPDFTKIGRFITKYATMLSTAQAALTARPSAVSSAHASQPARHREPDGPK